MDRKDMMKKNKNKNKKLSSVIGGGLLSVIFIGLLPFFLCGALIGGSAYSKNEEGNRLYREGKYEEALKKYTEAQLSLPESPELHYNIGNVLYRMGKYDEAVEEYSKALSAGKKGLSLDSRFNGGDSRYMKGDYGGAVESFIESLKMKPDDPDAKKNLELTLLRIQQQEKQQQQDRKDQSQQQQDKKDRSQQQQDQKKEDEQKQEQTMDQSDDQKEQSVQEQMKEKMLFDALDEQEKEALKKALAPMKEREKEVEKDW